MSALAKILTGMKAERTKKKRDLKQFDESIAEFETLLKERTPTAQSAPKRKTKKPARKSATK